MLLGRAMSLGDSGGDWVSSKVGFRVACMLFCEKVMASSLKMGLGVVACACLLHSCREFYERDGTRTQKGHVGHGS